MKKKIAIGFSIVILSSSVLTSCKAVQNTNKTQRGVAIGTTGGAVLGAILGNNLGSGGKGALGAVIGGVVGGVAGGLIGKKMDKQAREIQEQLPGAQVERVGEGIKLVLGENAVRFDFNKASLTTAAQNNLDKLVPVFKNYPDTNIKIYGYTDSKGADDYNLNLSEQRANAVKIYLANKGLIASRFSILGMGETDPIDSNETEVGRNKNRRVEFAILANDKMIEDAKSGN
jgi:outer membrane protein OmpA-like peptidoglycan-associated protein